MSNPEVATEEPRRRFVPDARLGGRGARLAKQRRWAEEMRADGWVIAAEPESEKGTK